MNWDDPEARAALIERVGIAEYNRLHKLHLADSTIETVNSHALRAIQTRFGRLIQVGSTGTAFRTIEEARRHAREIKNG